MSDLAEVKSEAIRDIITRYRNDLDYLQSSQICGILNINVRTLAALPVPRYPLPGGKIVFYRLSEIDAYFKSIREPS